tara:strand:+ start:1266 stop:1667 length:402 start_codon:yes stop_codon:yes gene_type:complete
MTSKQLVVCDSFITVLGVNEGYFHNNEVPNSNRICIDIQKITVDIYAETGKYVGVVVTPAKVIYNEEWGCPAGGEDVHVLTGNGFFEAEPAEARGAWKDAVELFILRIQEHFKQTTIQIEWSTKVVVRYEIKK